MHKELGITFIFVTHDQEEALMMSDKNCCYVKRPDSAGWNTRRDL